MKSLKTLMKSAHGFACLMNKENVIPGRGVSFPVHLRAIGTDNFETDLFWPGQCTRNPALPVSNQMVGSHRNKATETSVEVTQLWEEVSLSTMTMTKTTAGWLILAAAAKCQKETKF